MDDARSKYGRMALGVSAALYAFLSSPSPDTPGVVEILIITLIMLASFSGGFRINDDWGKPLLVLLAYGLSVPVLGGVFANAASSDMLRDLVAFGALALPLLLAGLFTRDSKLLLYILIGIGLIFSIRYLMMPDLVMVSLAAGPFDDRLLYLANSPLVFFAASWLLLQGSFGERKTINAILYCALALLPLAAMIGMMQRATLGLLALAWIGGLVFTLAHRPQRGVVMATIGAAVLIVAWPFVSTLAASLLLKTEMVGWNARSLEWQKIFAEINQGPLNVLFGRGWGSLMQSPAVGDEWVRFSHSLLSSMLWKAGWLGLLLTIVAIGTLCLAALRRVREQAVTVIALVLALLPACFLYGSYKSLCFGLLLTGLVALVIPSPDKYETD